MIARDDGENVVWPNTLSETREEPFLIHPVNALRRDDQIAGAGSKRHILSHALNPLNIGGVAAGK